MKLTKNGLALLAGIVRSCMTKKGEQFSCDQLDLFSNPKMVSLEKFRQIFPFEADMAKNLISFAEELKKENIDEETVALFFGGDNHVEHSVEQIRSQGIKNGVAKILLVFHMLLPVQILKDKKDAYSGLYSNHGLEIIFRNIQSVLCNGARLEVGQTVFIHYGYAVRLASKKLSEVVIEEQSSNTRLIDACMRTATIDCGKLISAFELMRKR